MPTPDLHPLQPQYAALFEKLEATRPALKNMTENSHREYLDLMQEVERQAYKGFALLTDICHADSKKAGWWTNLQTGECKIATKQYNVAEKLMLIVSEVAEAMEGDRKNLADDKLPHRRMIEVELADAVIRICDLAGAMKLDLAGAVSEKLAYNRSRADHKIENRVAEGGKAY